MGQCDVIDRQIMDILSKDSRTSYAEIARILHLSRVAVRERVNSLVERGFIEEFTIVTNAKALGFNLNVFLDIQVEPSKLEEVAQKLALEQNVFVVYQMTGPTTLHVHVFAKDTDELNTFMKERIYSIPGVLQVHSHILMARYKANFNIR